MANPTFWSLDGFEHGRAGGGTAGPYDAINCTIETSPVRTGSRALYVNASGAATRAYRTVPSSTREAAMVFAFRMPSFPGSGSVALANIANSSGNVMLRYSATAGRFTVSVNNVSPQNFGPTTPAVDTWYVCVLYGDSGVTTTGVTTAKARMYDTTGTLLGTETTATRSQTDADFTYFTLGTFAAETYQCYYDDWGCTVTSGDFDLITAPLYVYARTVTSDGTHNTTGGNYTDGSTSIDDATTDAYTRVDDIPVQYSYTAGQVITQTGNATSSYVECLFEDLGTVTGSIIDVRGYGTYRDASSVGSDLAKDERIVDASNTTIAQLRTQADIGTTIRCDSPMLTRPGGGWTSTAFNGIKLRSGFGDGSPDTDLISVMVEVGTMALATNATALPSTLSMSASLTGYTITGTATAAPSVLATAAALTGYTITAGATATPSTLALVAVLDTPTVEAIQNPTVEPVELSLAVVLDTPTTTAEARAPPSALATSVVLDTPTVLGHANASPSALATSVVLDTPTVLADANVIATVLARAAVIDTPTVIATTGGNDATALPSTLALSASVTPPTLVASATALPSTLALSAVLDTPTVMTEGHATALPSTLALSAVLDTPTVSGHAMASGSAGLAVVLGGTPTADANAAPNVLAVAPTLDTPTVVTTGDATATPDTLAMAVSITHPYVSTGFDGAQGPLIWLWGTAGISDSAIITPGRLDLSAVLDTPTIAADATATPSILAITVVLDTPTIAHDATATPPSLDLGAGLDTPTIDISGDATATPATLELAPVFDVPTGVCDANLDTLSTLALAAVLDPVDVHCDITIFVTRIAMAAVLQTPDVYLGQSVVAKPATLALAAVLAELFNPEGIAVAPTGWPGRSAESGIHRGTRPGVGRDTTRGVKRTR